MGGVSAKTNFGECFETGPLVGRVIFTLMPGKVSRDARYSVLITPKPRGLEAAAASSVHQTCASQSRSLAAGWLSIFDSCLLPKAESQRCRIRNSRRALRFGVILRGFKVEASVECGE